MKKIQKVLIIFGISIAVLSQSKDVFAGNISSHSNFSKEEKADFNLAKKKLNETIKALHQEKRKTKDMLRRAYLDAIQLEKNGDLFSLTELHEQAESVYRKSQENFEESAELIEKLAEIYVDLSKSYYALDGHRSGRIYKRRAEDIRRSNHLYFMNFSSYSLGTVSLREARNRACRVGQEVKKAERAAEIAAESAERPLPSLLDNV